MSSAISANIHDRQISSTSEPKVSIICLITRGHEDSGAERKTSTGQP